jgi:hypothetical protein
LGNRTQYKINRIFTGIMAVMMLFVMLFSGIFVVSHTDHDCTGEDCPICACISQCENILNGSGDNPVFSSAGVLPAVLVTASILISYCVVISDTPISVKVRMNN